MEAKMVWSAQTSNRKTGNVPTLYVGETKDEAWASCEGCALRDNKTCYAWNGTVRMGQAALLKGYVKNPSKYSFEEAMAKRSKSARMIRLGAIGDPARVNHSELKKFIAKARKEKLAVIGYTHHHREKVNEGLKKVLMASCDNMEQADEAVSRGWRATAVVPFDFVGKRFVTKAGNVGVVCPAQTAPESVTCNSCHLCDAARPTNFDIIAFRDHGPRARAAKRRKLPVL